MPLGLLGADPTVKPEWGAEIDWGHPQAAGMKLCHLLNEGGGTPFDIAGRNRAVVTGAPTWQPTVGGLGRGGYSTTVYDAIDPPQQIIGLAYPGWMAFGFVTGTVSANATPVSQASSTTSGGCWFTLGASGAINAFVRDDANTHTLNAATTATFADNLVHTFATVLPSPTKILLYLDGKQIASATGAALGPIATPILYTLGALRRPGIASPFLGSLLWHMAGNGSVPDMAWLAAEPFAAVMAPATRRFYSIGAGVTFKPWWIGQGSLLGGGTA